VTIVIVKNLMSGSRTSFPVYVPGAKLSLGKLHFSEGDGEMVDLVFFLRWNPLEVTNPEQMS